MAVQWWVWVMGAVVLLTVVLVTLFLIGLVRDRRAGIGRHAAARPTRDSFRKIDPDEPPPPKKRAAIIVNPNKVPDTAELTTLVSAVMAAQGWDVPLMLETTLDAPGGEQAQQALEAEVDLVCALGGDGTVRHVAQALAGGTTPLGLLPAGTGNLLARNLRVPGDSLEDALGVAMSGRNRHIDVGWVTLDPSPDKEREVAGAAAPIGSTAESVTEAIENAAATLAATDEIASAPLDASASDPLHDASPDRADDADGSDGADAADAAAADGSDDVADRDPAAPAEHAQVEPADPSADDPIVGATTGPQGPVQVAVSGVPARYAFLVMAGLGFDAAIMDGTSDELKASIGWPAYISGGMRNLLRRRFHTTLVLDDGEPQHFRTRTVLAGNCGRLTGGIVLMPDAAIDDGELNLVVISPKGLGGWAAVAAHVLTQRGSKHVRLDRFAAARAHVTVDEPQAVQADGDVLGEACSILVQIEPQSLIVRVGSPP